MDALSAEPAKMWGDIGYTSVSYTGPTLKILASSATTPDKMIIGKAIFNDE